MELMAAAKAMEAAALEIGPVVLRLLAVLGMLVRFARAAVLVATVEETMAIEAAAMVDGVAMVARVAS